MRERRRQPPGAGGFAIGARDGDDGHALRRVAVERGGHPAGLRFQAGQAGHGRASGQAGQRSLRFFGRGGRLHQAGRSALRQRGGHEAPPVGRRAGPGDEAVSRLHLAAVGAQLAAHALAQPLGGFFGRAQVRDGGVSQGHHMDSSAASLTICGLTFRSGCTPSVRSACSVTRLNRGAATRPP